MLILIEKAIDLDNVILSMSYIQSHISLDKRIKTIIILGYVGSQTYLMYSHNVLLEIKL